MSAKLEKLQFVIGLIDKISSPLTRIQARLHAMGLEQMRLFNQNFHRYGDSAAAASRKVALITAALTAAIAATGALTAALMPMAGMAIGGIGAALGTANAMGVSQESALLHQQTGIDAVTLQQYRLAGRSVGLEGGMGEIGDIGGIFTEVAQKQQELEDTPLLRKLNISIAEAKAMQPDQFLQRLVEQMDKLGMADTQKSQILDDLAGDASKLLPLLGKNAEQLHRFQAQANKVGAIITPEQTALLKVANTEWALMKTGLEGYGNIMSTVGGNFMKVFGPEINRWFADNADAMRRWADESVSELQRLHGVFRVGGLQAVYEDLFPNLSAFTRRVGAFVDGFGSSFASPFMRTVEATWARVSAVLGTTAGGAQGLGSAFGAAILPVMAATMEAIGDAVVFLEKNWGFVKQMFAWSPLGLVIANWGPITTTLEPVGQAVKALAEHFGLVAPGVNDSGSALGSLVGVLAAVAGVLFLNNMVFGAAYHIVKLYRGVLILLKATTMAATVVTWAWNAAMTAVRVGMIAIRAVSLVGFLMTLGASMAAASVGTWSLAGAMAVLTSPITLIIVAIAALAAGAIYLYTHWDEVKAYLGETSWGKALLAIFDAVMHPVDSFNSAVDYLKGLWKSVKASFAETSWGKAIIDTIESIMGWISKFTDGWAKLKNAASEKIDGAWGSIKATLGISGESSPANGGGRAVGGLIRAGVPYRVNERVPEVIISGNKTWVMNDQMARIEPLQPFSGSSAKAANDSATTGATGKLKAVLDIHSLSDAFADVGKSAEKGIVLGMDSRESTFRDFLNRFGNTLTDQLTRAWQGMTTGGQGQPLADMSAANDRMAGALPSGSAGSGGKLSKLASSPASSLSSAHGLGALSAKYESNGNAGAIGFDKKGGFSYGQYQIATKTGTMANFLDYLAKANPAMAEKLNAAGGKAGALAGSSAFKSAWGSLAQDKGFADAQHGFIQATHYDPLVNRIGKNTGIDINARSKALQDVIWSTAVQHGGATNVVEKALRATGKNAGNVTDEDLIKAIYAERSTRFGGSTANVRQSVLNRFQHERSGALAMLDGGAKATGGKVMPGHFYRVNERGPELLQTLGKTFLMTGGMDGNIIPFPSGNSSVISRMTHDRSSTGHSSTGHSSVERVLSSVRSSLTNRIKDTLASKLERVFGYTRHNSVANNSTAVNNTHNTDRLASVTNLTDRLMQRSSDVASSSNNTFNSVFGEDIGERARDSQSSLRELLTGGSREPAPAGGLRSMISSTVNNRERLMMQQGGKRLQIGNVHITVNGDMDAERLLHELEMIA